MNQPLLSVQDLCVRYPNQANPILENIQFTVKKGESILLIGSSGSGKSTLTLCLNGLIPKRIPCYVSGNIELDGQNIEELSLSHISQKVGMVFQNPEAQMLVAETVEEEVAFGLEMQKIPWAEMDQRITSSLAEVGLLPKRKEKVQYLSVGQKQKLALAAILAQRPQILILDEPSAALDPESTKDLFEILQRQKQQEQITLILIEHKLTQVLPWIDRVFLVTHQKLLTSEGSPLQFFQKNQALLAQEGIFTPSFAKKDHVFPSQTPISRNFSIEKPEIEVRNLSTFFGEKQILHQLCFTLNQGQWVSVVGENGAGKTTLVRHLIKDLTPPPRTIFLQGQDIRNMKQSELTQKVGFVFQNPEHQFLTDSVFEEFMLGFRLQKKKESIAREQSLTLLTQWGLLEQKDAHPFTLSQGQKRRLSLLTMLYLGQEILILDEPTWGLDQNNIHVLFQELLRLKNQGKTLLFITHDMDIVKQYSDQVLVLHQGSLLFHGTPTELFRNPAILQEAQLQNPAATENL